MRYPVLLAKSVITITFIISFTCLAQGKDEEVKTVPADLIESEILDESPFTESSNQSFFYAGKKKYEASLGGIGSYMKDLSKQSPNDYKSVVGNFNRLKKQKERAKTWSMYMAGAGGVALLAGLTILQDEERDANGQVEKKPNIELVAGGFIVGFVGSMVYLYLNPGEPEYIDFVEKHNKKVKTNIKWDLGYNPKHKAPSVHLGYNF